MHANFQLTSTKGVGGGGDRQKGEQTSRSISKQFPFASLACLGAVNTHRILGIFMFF